MRVEKLVRSAGPVIALAIVLADVSCHHQATRGDHPTGNQPAPLVGRIQRLNDYRPKAAIFVKCAAEASSHGQVPVDIRMEGSRRTYWDTNGIIDQALSVLFVRRDRPGMMAVAKADPHSYRLPSDPLPGRPSDQELDESTGTFVEEQAYDLLAYGRQHSGSADYYVLAAFSDAWQGPIKVRIADPSGPMASEPGDLEPKPASAWTEAPPASRGVISRLAWVDSQVAVVGGFRVAPGAAGAPPPNLSIVIARLRGRGGVVVGQVQVPSKMESGDQVGAFKVSVQDLRSARGDLDPGKYALFTFVGDEAAPVQVFQVE